MITEYILKVFGIIIASVLAEMLLPEKSMKKITRTVFSLCCVLTLLEPITEMVNSGESIIKFEFEEENEDMELTEKANAITGELYSIMLKNELEYNGYMGAVVKIFVEEEEETAKIKRIEIFFQNERLNEDTEHINRTSELKELSAAFFNIAQDKVIVYE